MQRAGSLRDYARAPGGRWVAGRCWLAFCRRPTLWGFALWGRVGADDMQGLLAALRLELAPRALPHASLVDASRLESADGASFVELTRYVEQHRDALTRQVTKLAIVHPAGFQGAIVAGFYSVLAPPYPVTLSPTLAGAVEALDLDDDDDSDRDLVRSLSDVIDGAAGTSPLLGSLRAAVRARPRLTLEEAARVVHLSSRTLQRRLGEMGESYSDLQASVRLGSAVERICTSAQLFTAIALDVGFASQQHMSRAVKKATGKTPSALRATASGAPRRR